MNFLPFDNKQIHSSIIQDDCISFNVRRSDKNHLKFPREVILIPSEDNGTPCLSVIPGIQSREKGLVQEIQQIVFKQNWTTMERYSFKISSNTFSFLWRFRTTNSWDYKLLTLKKAVDSKQESKIRSTNKKYQEYLEHNLTSGAVYLIPDREVNFNRKNRFKQPYSRYVLVLSVRNDKVLFAPFTTQINRMNISKDILIDTEYKGKALEKDVFPAVENFPYSIFKHKTAIIVTAIQDKNKSDFLNTALMSVGSIRKELLNFILSNR